MLEGWDEPRATAVVIPHGVTSIAASVLRRAIDPTIMQTTEGNNAELPKPPLPECAANGSP